MTAQFFIQALHMFVQLIIRTVNLF